MKRIAPLALAVSVLMFTRAAGATTTITFEDLTTRDSFQALGIENSYHGYQWGSGNGPGFANAVFGPGDGTGWASATLSDPALSPPPGGVSGHTYAWGFDGPTSMWINFQGTVDFLGGDFATLSPGYVHNSSTLQFFGYDLGGTLTASSSLYGLSDSMQTLAPDLSGITFLEIRTDAPRGSDAYFAADNLIIGSPAGVPDSGSTLLLMGIALGTIGAVRRRFLK